MTTQKEHHYVPQFFFRNFSHHPQRRRINLLLTRHRKVILDVKISNQGKRRRLYLTQEIEGALSRIEAGMSSCLRRIIDNFAGFHAFRTSEAIIHPLAGAFLLQAARLPARGERSHAAIVPLFHQATASQLLANPEMPSDLRDELVRGEIYFDYDYRYDVLNAIHVALIAPILFFDMTMALLVNATGIPFIFSDAPAISTNLYLWDFRDVQGITGFGSRGLIAAMPLCEFLALMFFDGGAYQLAADVRNPMYLNSEADVGLLNALQVHTAEDALYFGDKDSAEYVERLNNAHRPISGANSVVVRTARAEDGSSELFHYFVKPPPLRPDFSFLQVRRTPTDDDLRLPRNEGLMATVEQLMRASMSQDPAFSQESFGSAISDSFAKTVDLRERF